MGTAITLPAVWAWVWFTSSLARASGASMLRVTETLPSKTGSVAASAVALPSLKYRFIAGAGKVAAKTFLE